jgi:hypothetical protein
VLPFFIFAKVINNYPPKTPAAYVLTHEW